jgi:hypothetical protein
VTYDATNAQRYMARGRIVESLTQTIAHENGWDDPVDAAQAFNIAETFVDALIEDLVIWPSERWDEQCHDCEHRIGDHTVDGRCPGKWA